MILCVGEILVDMIAVETATGVSYERKAGGAPFNVSCGIKKFGGESAFVGSVGNDTVGKFLRHFAYEKRLDYLNIKLDEERNTTLAFVDLDENGERSFCFYRKNTADIYLPIIEDKVIENSNIVHIGSLMLSHKEGLDYAIELADRVHALGKLVSFDVNFREDIFPSTEEAILIYKQIMEKADILKLSEDEVSIFGQAYVDSLKNALICISLGSKGSKYVYQGMEGVVPTIKVKPVDTTGAGDAFYAGILSKLDKLYGHYSKEVLEPIFRFGNVCGALTTLGKGAIDFLPTVEEIQKYLN